MGLGLELGLETCGLGLDDFKIRGLGLGLGERGLGLATMGLDYISELRASDKLSAIRDHFCYSYTTRVCSGDETFISDSEV